MKTILSVLLLTFFLSKSHSPPFLGAAIRRNDESATGHVELCCGQEFSGVSFALRNHVQETKPVG
jgi:hypothetical protein